MAVGLHGVDGQRVQELVMKEQKHEPDSVWNRNMVGFHVKDQTPKRCSANWLIAVSLEYVLFPFYASLACLR